MESHSDKNIREAKERRSKGITVWKKDCDVCLSDEDIFNSVIEGGKIFYLCKSCFEDYDNSKNTCYFVPLSQLLDSLDVDE